MVITFATAPEDSKGTYEILPDGTIRMRFDDGRVEVGPVFIWDADEGRDPNQAGLHAITDTYMGSPES